MRPLTVLLGIIMGSLIAIVFGLTMVLVVFLILGTDHGPLRAERPSLLLSLAVFGPLTAVAAGAFLADLKRKSWRWLAIAALGVCLAVTVAIYWPRGI